MQKTYVLDTNVLIHDPDCMFNFQDNVVVVPYPVMQELDKMKKMPNGKAYASRKAIRHLDKLLNSENTVRKSYGYLCKLENNGQLIITGKWFQEDTPSDETILKYFRNISTSLNGDFPQPVIFVSKDISFRIRVALEGFMSEDYKTDKTLSFQKYGDVANYSALPEILSLFYYTDPIDEATVELVKVKNGRAEIVKPIKRIINISPKTLDQECAIDALTDRDIELVVLNGYAGTGKTLLALASGIHQVINNIYERVVVMRPVIPIHGTDIGYLPGDVKEKLSPWMQPIYDNLDLISQGFTGKKEKKKPNFDEIVQIQALTFIRGRSLPNSFIIIDEAQNLRPLDVKTIVTRAGEGTKIVFTGDLEQIDTPYLDATSSGLAYLVDRFINEPNFCYLNLKETVRSKLAEQGVRLL